MDKERGLPWWSAVKDLPCNAANVSLTLVGELRASGWLSW